MKTVRMGGARLMIVVKLLWSACWLRAISDRPLEPMSTQV